LAILLNATWTEIFSKQKLNPAMIAQMQDEGRFQLPMDLFIDAKSVRDAIAADQIKVPAEKTLYIHVLAGRDLLDRKLFERLIWIDTKDMIADGTTKGDQSVALTRSGRQTKDSNNGVTCGSNLETARATTERNGEGQQCSTLGP
jgi:hypothetical protein